MEKQEKQDIYSFAELVGIVTTIGASIFIVGKYDFAIINMPFLVNVYKFHFIVFSVMLSLATFEAYNFKVVREKVNDEIIVHLKNNDVLKILRSIPLFLYSVLIFASNTITKNSMFILLLLPLLYYLVTFYYFFKGDESKIFPCTTIKSINQIIIVIEILVSITFIVTHYIFLYFYLSGIVSDTLIYYMSILSIISSFVLFILIFKWIFRIKFYEYIKKGKVECKSSCEIQLISPADEKNVNFN